MQTIGKQAGMTEPRSALAGLNSGHAKVQCWGQDPSLHNNLATLGSTQSLEGKTARSFPWHTSGGAPASEELSQAASSWHFFDALEEPQLEEELSKQAQQLRNHKHEIESLKIEVRQLGWLIDSFAKTDHDFLELQKTKGEQAESFSSQRGLGGVPALIGSCFQAASFLNAEPVKLEPLQPIAPHTTKLSEAMASLLEAVVHLEAFVQSDSFNKNAYNTLGLELLRTRLGNNKLDQECVRDKACKSKFEQNKGEHNRVDIPEKQQNKLKDLGQNKQLLEGQLRHDLETQQKNNSFEQLRVEEHKNKPKSLEQEEAAKAAEACTARSAAYSAKPQEEPQLLTASSRKKTCKKTRKKQQQTAAASDNELHIGSNNSLGIGEQEPMGSLEQQTLACKSPKHNLGRSAWRILVDTGSAISVAPWSFAEEVLLSPLEEAIELHTATGEAIKTLGIRTVKLDCREISFVIDFVIAEVSQPLLGLSSLIRENLSLQLDSQHGYQLCNLAGNQVQLEHSGQQVYLVACPGKLDLESCFIGNLLDSSLMPDKKLEHNMSFEQAKQEVQEQGGANSFPLDSGDDQQQLRNKQALGTTALPEQVTGRVACNQRPKKPSAPVASQQLSLQKRKQKGQSQADKLRALQMTSFIAKVQLDLLTQDPENSLGELLSRDLSLRIFLTSSLMRQWQLRTVRLRIASPQQVSNQLRSLGLKISEADKQIFVGDQLGVMMQGTEMLVGGEKLAQDCFMHKLSAKLLLEDTTELAEGTPLNFSGRTLEYKQADNSISLQLSPCFFLQLIGRYSLEAEATRTTSLDELSATASNSNSVSLNAKRAKLYKKTVGALCRAVVLRPDLTLAVQKLSLSMSKPTEQSEEQLLNVLRYIKGTLGHKISLQPPRRWQKASSFELLAFTSSSSWSGAGRSSGSLCLFFLGVPLATSIFTQALTARAAELECVKRASSIASHTTTLLQDLQLDEPVTLRVLLGGPVAKQLGLSRNHRHIQLRHRMGQLQLSKVRSNQNLATCLTDNSASGLERLLLKLKMHAQPDCARALPTVRCAATASFKASSGSFLVGMVTKAPAMEQLLRTDCILELSDHKLFGKELVANFADPKLSGEKLRETLAYEQLLGKEIEKDSLDILGNQSLRMRTSSLEKKNFCFRVIQLVCLAFWSVLGSMILDLPSLQQRELAAAYPYKTQSLNQQELVAVSESLTLHSWSLPMDSLTFHSLSFENVSLQSLNLLSLSLIDGDQIRSLQQQELKAAYLDGSTRACMLQLELSQKELAAYALTEQISLQESVPQRKLTADEACKSLRFSPTRACFQLSQGLIDKSFELLTAQLCDHNLAQRASSSKTLYQLELYKAQFKSQLPLQTGHLSQKMQADSSFELSIAQLCFKAQLPTGSIRACQLPTAQLCFNNLAWIRPMQPTASTSIALSRSAGAFQQTAVSQPCNLAAASAAITASGRSTPTRTLQSVQGEIQTTALTTRSNQLQQDKTSNKPHKKDSFQLDLAELDLHSFSFSNQLDRVQLLQPNMQEHLSRISFQLTCAALLVATLVAQSLVSNSSQLQREQLSKQKPHKEKPIAFTTRPLAASTTRSTTSAWRSRVSTALAARSAAAAFNKIASSNRSSSLALRTTSSNTTSGSTRSSHSLRTLRSFLSFVLVFLIGIVTNMSLPPSFQTSSLINCWDLELEPPNEHITSFGKKLVEKEELTISWWKATLLQIEILEHLQLSKALVPTQLREHLLHHHLQVQQLSNKQMQDKGSAWLTQLQQQQQQKTRTCPAQLQQNLCQQKLDNKQLEFTKKNFDRSIFKRNTLQLNKFQPSDQQQQQHKTQLQKQIANQKLQNRVPNQQLQQSVAQNQLQKNLLQVQEQLQTSNQQAISLQQLSFDNNNGKAKILDKSFQGCIFVTLVFQINFSASKGLAQQNFPNKPSLENSLGDAEGVACTEPPQLLQEQLSRRDLCQHSFSDSSLTEESSTTATSQTPALRTRASNRQLQRQQQKEPSETAAWQKEPSETAAWQKEPSETAAWQKNLSDQQLWKDYL